MQVTCKGQHAVYGGCSFGSSRCRLWCVALSVLLAALGSYAAPAALQAGNLRIIDDSRMLADFREKVSDLIAVSNAVPDLNALQEQLARRSCSLDLPTVGTNLMTPAEIYAQRIESVVMVGTFYHCSSRCCRRLHSSVASGVILHTNGVFVTNYHVMESTPARIQAIAVMTIDGDVFLADEVLAADPNHDVAIVSLQDAAGLTAAPVRADEPVGNPVTLITHPKGQYFSLTSGYVSRYHRGEHTNLVMNITADYAVGSSGGAIFNHRGDVAGLVSSTTSIAARTTRFGVDPATGHLLVPGAQRTRGLSSEEHETPEGDSGEDDDHVLDIGKKEEPEKKQAGRRQFVQIPLMHQMTVKNAVPARAILDLIRP